MFINGSTLTTLNSENTGTLEDRQYFMAGSNGGTAVQRINTPIEPNTVYKNGSIDGDMIPLNIKTPTYKAQWTGFAADSLRVTLIAPQDYYYIEVSIDANFIPNNTKIYPVVSGKVEADFAGAYKYFRFIGFAPGPGGVISGLKLWLRADDETAIVLSSEKAGNGRLASYSAIKGEDPDNVPTVTKWSDLVRGHDFVQSTSGNSREPVYRPSAPDMNYHPSVFFWFYANSNTGQQRAYLWNKGGILDVARPTTHTAMFMINNNFISGQHSWVYTMLFSQAPIGGSNAYQGPGYGLNRDGLYDGRGRFRASDNNDNNGNGVSEGAQNLFKAGSSTILGYYPRVVSGNNVQVLFRFNAQEEIGNCQYNSNTDMRNPSQLGTGYGPNRTINGVMSEAIIFDRELNQSEKIKVETYLALKYGVTLYPSNIVSNRFDYILSDSTVLWKGDVATSDPTYGKFAKYYNRIAAVIRDDVARLNNRQTHSTHVGSLLHLGLAGRQLSDVGNKDDLGYWENNMEAVIFGDDGATGEIPNGGTCGNFEYRFNRIWLIHKMTENDRPVSLLVGAQDNSSSPLGNDPLTANYYAKLIPSNDICLIVGKSPADIASGNYTVVIPMVMINGEYQCTYNFTEKDTYITFGYRPNNKGCYSPEEAQFIGKKNFQWTQYTSRTNRSTALGLTVPATPFATVDLGDNIVVNSTKLVYPGTVRANRGYPRSSNYPVRGSLEVRRSRGGVDEDIVITIVFDKAVMPSFSISGIDDYRYTSYDEVSITGTCSGSTFYPHLSPANTTPSYKIIGNTATANKRARLAGNNKSGMVNVEFRGAVEKVEIRYRLKNRVRGTQRIFISPITLEATTPPPPINDKGIGFAKYADVSDITTCETVTYTVHLVNANCEPKYFSFTDQLMPEMSWEFSSFALDTLNTLHNPSLKVNDYGGNTKLAIDSLLILGSSEIKFKSTAVFDENAPSGIYKNVASITYDINTYLLGELIKTEEVTEIIEVPINVEWRQRQEKLQVEVISKPTYSEDIEFEVTYKITNPNTEITDVFMEVDFNDAFYYVANSFLFYTEDPYALPAPGDPVLVTNGGWLADVLAKENNYLSLAGDANGDNGFNLPSGISYITFKIKTPVYSSIEDDLDENGQKTGNKEPLLISHSFLSEMDDPCMIEAMDKLDGVKIIPYSKRKTHIPSNGNITTKMKKKK